MKNFVVPFLYIVLVNLSDYFLVKKIPGNRITESKRFNIIKFLDYILPKKQKTKEFIIISQLPALKALAHRISGGIKSIQVG